MTPKAQNYQSGPPFTPIRQHLKSISAKHIGLGKRLTRGSNPERPSIE